MNDQEREAEEDWREFEEQLKALTPIVVRDPELRSALYGAFIAGWAKGKKRGLSHAERLLQAMKGSRALLS